MEQLACKWCGKLRPDNLLIGQLCDCGGEFGVMLARGTGEWKTDERGGSFILYHTSQPARLVGMIYREDDAREICRVMNLADKKG